MTFGLLLEHSVESIFKFMNPNILEPLSVPSIDEIREIRTASAHDDLKRWLGGDHSVNNQWRGTPPEIFPGRSLYEPPAR